MNHKDVLEVMVDSAKSDAKLIIRNGGTVSLKCQEKLRFLLKFSANPDTAYYRKGKECYDAYIAELVSLVDAYDRASGLHRTTNIPAWPKKST